MLTSVDFNPSPNDSVWQNCLEIIKDRVGDSSYDTWFKSTGLSMSENRIPHIEVPNQFFADFIEEHFSELIKKVLSQNGICSDILKFIPTERDWKILEPVEEPDKNEFRDLIKSQPDNKTSSQFNPDFSFENFVVGDNNRMANTASLAVAEAPGITTFNPLIIHGKTGLGKTHLLHSIGRFAQEEETAGNVLYISSHSFINQYINYVINKKDSTSFYKQFSSVDLLLIDDIHFFSGKPGTQKEFFRIFNRLLLEKKQIVLTSDRPPDRIPDMMHHIINRFLGGLITDIQPPNFDTRMAIIQKKCEIDGFTLPEEVVKFVARHITSNVRELEGTLIKLIASSSFTGRPITLEATHEIFNDVIAQKQSQISVHLIKKTVAEHFKISSNLLSAHTRKRNVTYPRNIAMYLSKKWTKQSLRTIGLSFGGRDYSTVIHASKKIEKELESDKDLKNHVKNIEETFKDLHY